MLSMVVLNERSDLENTHVENSKDAFESIKALKDIENQILVHLTHQATELLNDENMLKSLNESKNTAEYVASKLENISVTNQYIEQQRDVYSRVAYRTSILFFAIQELWHINPMYKYSLEWYK